MFPGGLATGPDARVSGRTTRGPEDCGSYGWAGVGHGDLVVPTQR